MRSSRILTLGTLSRETGISRPTLRLYADSRLIPCEVDTVGRRLFPASAIARAVKVHAERTAAR
jgi:DNA-binding transcriptional MerR regulator